MNQQTKKYRAGDLLKNDILITKVHEWENYFDLEVLDRKTGEAGSVRVQKEEPQEEKPEGGITKERALKHLRLLPKYVPSHVEIALKELIEFIENSQPTMPSVEWGRLQEEAELCLSVEGYIQGKISSFTDFLKPHFLSLQQERDEAREEIKKSLKCIEITSEILEKREMEIKKLKEERDSLIETVERLSVKAEQNKWVDE